MKNVNEYVIGNSIDLLKNVEDSVIDLIYIDPPYCTGRDFYHFDDRFQSSEDYRENFIRPMLKECHRILTDVGNIVIHVEPKISHHIRIVLDDIFGERRFKNEIVWVSGGNHKSKNQLHQSLRCSTRHDIAASILARSQHQSLAFYTAGILQTTWIDAQPNCVVWHRSWSTRRIQSRRRYQ